MPTTIDSTVQRASRPATDARAPHPGSVEPARPNPGRIFSTINSFQNGAAIKAAVELDFFTAIAEGHNTAAQLAQRCQVAARGARILGDHLTILGFLTKSHGVYGLANDAALFLNRNSPAYMGAAVEFLLTPALMANFTDLADRVRRGGAPIEGNGMLAPDNEVWVRFARGMAGLMSMPAQSLARHVLGRVPQGPMKILDIAAGHGMFGIAFAQQHPDAQVVGLDWANVLAVAQENARKFGVADRYTLLPGDALTADFGGDYDVVLLPNFLHHFDASTDVSLLQKVHAALKPGGQVAIVEFAPNDDRISPPPSAVFALTMLAGTPSGDAYTVSEIEKMLADASFQNAQWSDLPESIQRVITAQRPA
jgi:ubiquinone/menaquinone biosynthesis C-methylase UbiE